MKYRMQVHGTVESTNQISPSSMKFHGIKGAILNDIMVRWNSIEYSVEFHRTQMPPNQITWSAIEFHGTSRMLFLLTSGLHRLPWNVHRDSMDLLSRH